MELEPFFTAILESGATLYASGAFPGKPAILVHSALSAFGRVEGGGSAVAGALINAARKKRFTVVMPAHGGQDCAAMGAIADSFRTTKGVKRSAHPELAFCARGPVAGKLLCAHRAEFGLGEKSPVGKLFELDGLVLMLGTGYETCTAMHLAEYRAADELRSKGMKPDMVTCWKDGKTWEDIVYRTELFPEAGLAFESTHPEKIRKGPMPGDANRSWRLFRVRDIVVFCVDRYRYLQ